MAQSQLVFTDKEEAVLSAYRNPRNSGIGRAVRLSAQYALGAGIFLWLAIVDGNPWYSVAVYAIFVFYMSLRVWAGSRIAGIMPGIISKYESRIRDLESKLSAKGGHNIGCENDTA